MSGMNDDAYLRQVAQAAKRQALRVGKLETADSIEVLFKRSHSDPRLRYLMLTVLRQNHTAGEAIEFQAYVYMSRKHRQAESISTRKSRNSLGLRLPYVKKKNAAPHTFTTQASQLLALPAELREIIYGYVVGPNRNDGVLIISKENIKNRIGFLGTCRQIRSEAAPMFYHDSTRFEVVINGDIFEPVVGWFKSVGVQNCQRLRCVILRHELREKDKSEYRRVRSGHNRDGSVWIHMLTESQNNNVPLSGSDIGALYLAQEILAQPLVKALAICGVPAGSISTPESIPATYTERQRLEFLASLTDANWGREISKAIAAQFTAFKTQST